LAFVRNGCHVLWLVTPTPATVATLDATTSDMLNDLIQYDALFQAPSSLPPAPQRYHRIRLLPGTMTVAVRPYRYAYTQEEIERQCADLLQLDIIRPSESAFSTLVLLIKKHDGSWRMCVDYRGLNDKTIKDKFMIPIVEELLDKLQGATFFTKLNLCSGYHQVLMHPDDIEKTAFWTHQGLFEFLVMPFRPSNAPATFQVLMNEVLQLFLTPVRPRLLR
jgi:hypothetical protein